MSKKPHFDDLPYRPCAGLCVINREGRVFIGRRLDGPEHIDATHVWQMPQGGIDKGETPVEAAWREMHEEIGTAKAKLLAESRGWHHYDLPADLIPRLWGGRFRGQEQKWFAFRFTGVDDDIDIATKSPEFSAWKWAALAQLPDLIVPFKRQLYSDLVAEFGHLVEAQTKKGRRHA